jgi:hypothetical protein
MHEAAKGQTRQFMMQSKDAGWCRENVRAKYQLTTCDEDERKPADLQAMASSCCLIAATRLFLTHTRTGGSQCKESFIMLELQDIQRT